MVYFRSFQTQYCRKIVGFSGIRTWIVGVEGEYANHLTTTTTQLGKKPLLTCDEPFWGRVGLFHYKLKKISDGPGTIGSLALVRAGVLRQGDDDVEDAVLAFQRHLARIFEKLLLQREC